MEQPGREHRAGVAGRDDGVGLAGGDGADRGDEARVGFARTASAGLSAISIGSGASTSRRPLRVEPGRAVERHVDPVGGRIERTEDHLGGRIVSAQSVDCDARHVTTELGGGADRPRGPCTCRRSGRCDARASASRSSGTC